MKHALFAYNPVSGNRFISKHIDFIIEKLQSYGVYLTVYRIPEDDTDLKEIMTDRFDLIIGSGGDGTLSQIVQVMLENRLTIPFFALGAGTSNNFTRSIDLSRSINTESQLENIIDVVFSGSTGMVDIGIVNDEKVFLTSLAGGAFVDTSYMTDKNLKLVMGPLAYYLKPFTELTALKTYDLEITVDGIKYDEKAYMFLLLNGKSVGTFSNFIDTGNISDGIMELIIIRESTTIEIANLFFSVMKGEDITRHSNVKLIRGNRFLIDSEDDITISIDGEKGPEMPLSVEVKKGCLKVLVPKNFENRGAEDELQGI